MVDLLKCWRAGRQWAIIMGTECLGVAAFHGRPCWGQGAAATQAARAYSIVTARAYGIEIGRETTYLTDPLLADGMVDYAAAMNAEAGKGVTPENNAACLMSRIVRPDEDKWSQTYKKTHDEVLAKMGVDAKAGKVMWTESPDKLDQMATARGATSRPWKAAEMPELAAWLESNKAAMALFVEASRRREWWNPATQSPTWLESAESGLWRSASTAATSMWMRSMLKLGEGDVRGAWEDLAACERMAGLMGRSPDRIGRLVAGRIHAGAMEAMWGMVEHGELSAEMLQRMDALLREQRTWPTGGEVIPQSERYQFLVQVAYWAKGMQKAVDKGGNGLTEKLQAAGLKLPDWNRIMRLGNKVFDMAQADEARMSGQERAEHRRVVAARISELEVIHRESKSKMRADGTMDETWLMPQGGETQDAYSDRVGGVVIMMMPPNAEGSGRFFDMCNGRTAWTRVAVALLRYRQDRGGYPADLKALVPGYLAALPEANATWPMRYERTAKGFALTNETGATTREGAKLQKITIRRER